MTTWCQTYSGGRWEILDPNPADVHWPDIATQLAGMARFNRATIHPWSVASHSCFVEDILRHQFGRPDLAPYGLLHDVHEVFLGDIISPVKRAIAVRVPVFRGAWQELCDKQDAAIFAAARLPWPLSQADAAELHRADLTAFATERAQLMIQRADWEPLPPPVATKLLPESEERARKSFLVGLQRYGIYVPKPQAQHLMCDP